jgi:Ras GTPase-activating-like protein IQGAP2/3
MSVMIQPNASRASTASSTSAVPPSLTRQNTMSSYDGSRSARQSKRYSMSALYMSMSANEGDLQIEDDLAKAQKILRDLKTKISSQSKKNFVLEKDVRYLDSRIALLIQNRMALEEVCSPDPWALMRQNTDGKLAKRSCQPPRRCY